MKNIFYILLAGSLASILFSCSEDIMDRINENPNNPGDVPGRLTITDIMANTAYNVVGNSFNFYASAYIEHNVGIYGQLYNAEIRAGEPISSTTYNNTWNSAYENLYNLKLIIQKCSDDGNEKGNYHLLGVSQILTAYNLSLLTDAMGDTPWEEACQPAVIFTPKLDKQKDIYDEIFSYLDKAITNLEKPAPSGFPNLKTQDFVYGGNIPNWIKFAYGLKARLTMRLSNVTPDYNKVIEYANKSFTNAKEQCIFSYDGSTIKNPNYKFFKDRDYFGSSKSLHKKLTDRNDPRVPKYFKAYPQEQEDKKDTLIFAPNGNPDQEQGKYGISGLLKKDAPTFFMSYHELQFLKAEAYARTDRLVFADSLLLSAIKASMTKYNVNLTESVAIQYYNDVVKARFDSEPLQEIMLQKYIAFFDDESLEAYNDYRRLKAMGDDFIKLDNPNNAKKFPLRYTYGANDVTTNENVSNAYGDGTYVYSENVWWAGGKR